MASNGESKDASQDNKTEEGTDSAQAVTEDPAIDQLTFLLQQAGLASQQTETPEQLLGKVTFEGVADYIKSGKAKNIVIMAGAGISTSAGIPDFRSPGTGLYDNLEKYNLPDPMAIFDLGYFKTNPEPFFQLSKELWPGIFKPTPCHYFIRLVQEKGLLLRHYTQNIDTLERVAGVNGDQIVEAHGTFHTGHCLDCQKEYTQQWMKEQVFKETILKCSEEACEGIVKPDIIFFGESLPPRFFSCARSDLAQCDLLIVMGTSLVVQPFASLVNRVSDICPRLYINLEKSGGGDPIMVMFGYGHGFKFDDKDNYRDVFHQKTCDDGCYELADLLGWGDELRSLVKREHERIDSEMKTTEGTSSTQVAPDKSPKEQTKSGSVTKKSSKTPDKTSDSPGKL